MTSREQFEAWYWREIQDENFWTIEVALRAWQASREALEVELPEWLNRRVYLGDEGGTEIMVSRDRLVRELQRQGIKVKA